jgi:hypothetical protein
MALEKYNILYWVLISMMNLNLGLLEGVLVAMIVRHHCSQGASAIGKAEMRLAKIL